MERGFVVLDVRKKLSDMTILLLSSLISRISLRERLFSLYNVAFDYSLTYFVSSCFTRQAISDTIHTVKCLAG
jgi:hypothetical protein